MRKSRKKNTAETILKCIIILLLLMIIGCGVAAVIAYNNSKPKKEPAVEKQDGNVMDEMSEDTIIHDSENITTDDSEKKEEKHFFSEENDISSEDDISSEEVDVSQLEDDSQFQEIEEEVEETPEPTPKLKGKKVAIDAGHQSVGDSSTEPVGPGASERKAKVAGGATGVRTGIPEYKLTLEIAKKLKKELKNRGYEVFMVRTKNDVNISNAERAVAVNKSGADICIRIHADGVDDHSVRGASALYPTKANPYVSHLSKPSQKLSNCVLNSYCAKTGIRNRGLSARNDLTGTNWSNIPVTLIELGFLSNSEEDLEMHTPDFQKNMVVGIANGIDKYFK